MKNNHFFVICGFILLTIVSCNKNNNTKINIPLNTGVDISQMSNSDIPTSIIPTEVLYVDMPIIPTHAELQKEAAGILSGDKIDIDLSVMSSTMVYSQVFNMVIMPEEFEGKNLKIKGNFVVYVSNTTGERYYSVIIPDATACCQQGIEFIWVGDHPYPESFPEIGQEITVTGYYVTTTTSDGLSYSYMQVTDLVF